MFEKIRSDVRWYKSLPHGRKKMHEIVKVVLMVAKNTTDGNPQRVYVAYDEAGNVVSTADYGYLGENAAPWVKKWHDEHGYPVEEKATVGEYQVFVKMKEIIKP